MRNTHLKILSFFIILLSARNNLLAQQPYFEEEHFAFPASEIKHVSGIAADKNNCIWFATQTGVFRYDGTRFRHYSVLNTPALKFERMTSILLRMNNHGYSWCIADSKGNLYEVDSSSNLQPFFSRPGSREQIIYEAYTYHILNPEKDKIASSLRDSIFETNIIPSTKKVFLTLLNGDILSMPATDFLRGGKGTLIYKTKNVDRGKILATNKSFYAVTHTGLLRWKYSLQPQPVVLAGDIMANNLNGINYDSVLTLKTSEPGIILLWYDGNIYQATESGDNNKLDTRLLIKGQDKEPPETVFYSPAQQLFISYFVSKGLVFYRPRQFSLLAWQDPVMATKPGDYYYNLIPSDSGFITISNAGLIWLGRKGEQRMLNKETCFKTSLFKDRSGHIWYQQQKDNLIMYLQAGTGNSIPVMKDDTHNSLTGVYQPDDSTYYLLSTHIFRKLIIKNGIVKHTQILYTAPANIELNVLYALDSGVLWLGSDRGLMKFIIADNRIKNVADLDNAYIRAVTKLNENNYLVGTYDKGIYQFRNGKWIHLSPAGKNMPASAHAFIIDKLTSSVWVSSNEGILHIPLQQLLQNNPGQKNNITFGHFTNFGPDISSEFNGSNNVSGAQLSDTCIAFANAKGLVVFNPQKLISYPLPLNVLVEPVNESRNDALSKNGAGSNHIEFNPIVPYFGYREDIEVLYHLTNSDDEWHQLSPGSIISYNNLIPGNHDLQFRIRHYYDQDGKQVFFSAKSFYIPYRWYQTTWFKIAVSILVLLLFISLHYLRVWYVLRRDKQVRQLLEKYHLLFDNSPVPMWVIDPASYYFLDVNEAAIGHYGYSKKEFLGMTVLDLRSEKDIEHFLQAFEKPPKSIVSMGVFKHRRKDGSFVDVEIYSGVIIHNNKSSRLAIAIDITKRVKYEKELQELSIHLQNIREEERTRIAREIHDVLGQYLTVLKMDVSWLNKKIGISAEDSLKEKMKDLMNTLDVTIKSVRRISSELRPSLLDDLGLEAAMEWQLEEFEKRSGIKISFTDSAEKIKLPDKVSTELFRILQESLTNVARHAEATNVKVSLNNKNNNFVLTIKDDGKGFDKNKIANKKTLGLLGMRERTAVIGGTYDITSTQGDGTIVVVTVPLDKS